MNWHCCHNFVLSFRIKIIETPADEEVEASSVRTVVREGCTSWGSRSPYVPMGSYVLGVDLWPDYFKCGYPVPVRSFILYDPKCGGICVNVNK